MKIACDGFEFDFTDAVNVFVFDEKDKAKATYHGLSHAMKAVDLIVELPFLRLTGGGKVNFVEATLDYKMDARVVESPELAGELSAAELKDFTSANIPLKISGPLASPSIAPDFELMLKREVKKQIDKEKDKLINRLLGIKEEPAEGEQAEGEPQEEGEEGQDEEQKAEDKRNSSQQQRKEVPTKQRKRLNPSDK